MSFNNPYSRYRQTQVETANHLKMIIMLYDGAIRFLQQAIIAMEQKDTNQQCLCFNKALAIIDHLGASLDLSQGGEIAADLARLFPYFHDRATVANVKDDRAAAQEVIEHLRTLRGAWASVAEAKTETDQPADSPEQGQLSMAA